MTAFIGQHLTEISAASTSVCFGADSANFKVLVSAKHILPTEREFNHTRQLCQKYT